MDDTILIEHVKRVCKTALEHKKPMAILWYAASFDDKLHRLRLESITRLFDIVPGGFANISGANWQMFEQKCSDRPGIYVFLRLVQDEAHQSKPVTQEGMVTQNRPHNAAEWKAWAINHMQEQGVPLKVVNSYQPPTIDNHSIDWSGAFEAEGRTHR